MHNRSCLFFLIALTFCLAVEHTAQAFTPPVHAHFTATVSPQPIAGKTVTVTVQAVIDSGWHIYSVVPSPGGPFATALSQAGPGWKPLGKTQEDTPIREHDPNFGVDVGYHVGKAVFEQQERVTKLSPHPTITVSFQTCSGTECMPPATAIVPLVTSQSPPPPLTGPGASTAQGAAKNPDQTAAPSSSARSGLVWFLLAAFGAGLLTLLTPCVFPLIPITLTSFIKQADGSRARLVRLSGGFALGIIVLYVGLGVVVTALAGATGLSQLGTNPWVNLLIFALFVVFALSFFETVSLALPVNLAALQNTGRRHGGVVGLGLLGIAFVLASFTCVAPFVGTLLVASASGSLLRPVLGLLFFSLAFAAPFFVFAAAPQWISRIPRSGPWMSRVKATLGFLELAASLKFLSNADLYWQWKILTQPVLLTAWILLFLCAALYLLGYLKLTRRVDAAEPAAQSVSWGRGAAAGFFLLLAGYCFWGLSGRPISLLQTYLPPLGYGGATSVSGASLPWLTSYPEAVAAAKAQNKPLLIDFTGNFCTNCRYNENVVFPARSVQAQLTHFVRLQLYTDGQGDAANQKLEERKFGSVALPLYGILNPNTRQPVTQIAGIQTRHSFTQFLSQAGDSDVAER